MYIRTTKSLGNYKGNDVELCRTTNARVVEQTSKALMDAAIPFTSNTIKIPFFQREQYNGASEILVILTSPRRYSQARRIIDSLDLVYRERLIVSNY